MHDEIKRFYLDGEIGHDNLIEAKERLVNFLETQMRDNGYVPALDLEPQFTRSYDLERDTYDFVLTIYGIQVGRESAWKNAGIMSGKMIQKYTPQAKSRQF